MEVARLFFAWLALFLLLPHYLRAWYRPQEKPRDKGTVRFHYKNTKFIPCFVHAFEIYFIFYILRVNFFCVVSGRFRHCESHIYIKQGRHPVIYNLLPENEQFVPNDTDMNVGPGSESFHLHTIHLLRQIGDLLIERRVISRA